MGSISAVVSNVLSESTNGSIPGVASKLVAPSSVNHVAPKRQKLEIDGQVSMCPMAAGSVETVALPLKRKKSGYGKPKSKVVEVNITLNVAQGDWPPQGLYLDRTKFRLKRSKGTHLPESVRFCCRLAHCEIFTLCSHRGSFVWVMC